MVIVTQNTKKGMLVLYKNCKENLKQKILLNFIFSGKWEDTDTISAPNALDHPAHGCKSTVWEPLT
jgi:hypothetical protein